jgi:hypothetical protein
MTTIEFPHKAPKGMYYEQTEFKRNVVAIKCWTVGGYKGYNSLYFYKSEVFTIR